MKLKDLFILELLKKTILYKAMEPPIVNFESFLFIVSGLIFKTTIPVPGYER